LSWRASKTQTDPAATTRFPPPWKDVPGTITRSIESVMGSIRTIWPLSSRSRFKATQGAPSIIVG